MFIGAVGEEDEEYGIWADCNPYQMQKTVETTQCINLAVQIDTAAFFSKRQADDDVSETAVQIESSKQHYHGKRVCNLQPEKHAEDLFLRFKGTVDKSEESLAEHNFELQEEAAEEVHRLWQNNYTDGIDDLNFDLQAAYLAAIVNWTVLGQQGKRFAKHELQELEEEIRTTVEMWKNDLNGKTGYALKMGTAGLQVAAGVAGFTPGVTMGAANGIDSGASALIGKQVAPLNLGNVFDANSAEDMGKLAQMSQSSMSSFAGAGNSVSSIDDSKKQSKVTVHQSAHSCHIQWLQTKGTEVQDQSQQKEKAQRAMSDAIQQANQARMRMAAPAA